MVGLYWILDALRLNVTQLVVFAYQDENYFCLIPWRRKRTNNSFVFGRHLTAKEIIGMCSQHRQIVTLK